MGRINKNSPIGCSALPAISLILSLTMTPYTTAIPTVQLSIHHADTCLNSSMTEAIDILAMAYIREFCLKSAGSGSLLSGAHGDMQRHAVELQLEPILPS